MAPSSTQFDQAQVQGVARRTGMARDISPQLETLHGEVQATMAGASSSMAHDDD